MSDGILQTCITFDTEAEAKAFMLGVVLAEPGYSEDVMICARIDPEEPFTVLTDVSNDRAEYYLEKVLEFKRGKP